MKVEGYYRIRKLRKSNRITLEQMAEYLHISRHTYSNYESGRKTMPVWILVQIAQYFNQSLDFLADHESSHTKEVKEYPFMIISRLKYDTPR